MTDTDLITLVRHIAATLDAQSEREMNPYRRYRTPLGVSPVLDTQRRIATVLVANGAPMTLSQLTSGHLTRLQRDHADIALSEGVKAGVFATTGGITTRGARYTLVDPTQLGATWAEVKKSADDLNARRVARSATA